MKFVYYMTYVMILVYTLGETVRRGVDYFAINATTMLEDYSAAVFFTLAVWTWHKASPYAEKIMLLAWAYATGAMFVPFFAHLEAYLRGATFREDHIHTDVESIILKGSIWLVSVMCLYITFRSDQSQYPRQ
ncbi:hypothetical protein SIN8267_01254 [Sinobacterium norvegicum]|uniref:Uncharacterized protein n=1 Tax=Sinobacterium norvegicum TaxID=1641715 RepID=A0ABM9ADT2_9GAMM|nr:hypothetical protein [Sinobacterium norvegicum]CAH0991152.1 hypothetical protein SIN8267_01254 [Sinobacterium norvegicum]